MTVVITLLLKDVITVDLDINGTLLTQQLAMLIAEVNGALVITSKVLDSTVIDITITVEDLVVPVVTLAVLEEPAVLVVEVKDIIRLLKTDQVVLEDLVVT